MANRIAIGAFSSPPPPLPLDAPPDKLLAEMAKSWREQLSKVLPDRPDIILLPCWAYFLPRPTYPARLAPHRS